MTCHKERSTHPVIVSAHVVCKSTSHPKTMICASHLLQARDRWWRCVRSSVLLLAWGEEGLQLASQASSPPLLLHNNLDLQSLAASSDAWCTGRKASRSPCDDFETSADFETIGFRTLAWLLLYGRYRYNRTWLSNYRARVPAPCDPHRLPCRVSSIAP